MTLTPAEWKRFYAAERARLGRSALEALLAHAPPLPRCRAVIFPHTRLEVTGAMTAAAARWVTESAADEALAIGVLHGGAPDPRDEFSLDAFEALLALSPRAPRLRRHFSDAAVDIPPTIPIVATADMVHHGIGYGATPSTLRDPSFARASIESQLRALSAHDFEAFLSECASARSDFKNAGRALALTLGPGFSFTIHSLEIVDYSAALAAPPPTWVAAALITIT